MAAIRAEDLYNRLAPRSARESLYGIFDGARDPRIHPAIVSADARSQCLYIGRLAPVLARAAPYLVQLPRASRFAREFPAQGWGHSWGIYVHSAAPFEAVHRHLRRFLKVRDTHGASLVFRYYDPRVMRLFLPSCDADQLTELFGTVVSSYLLEDAVPANVLMFRNADGQLERGEATARGPVHWLQRYLKEVREREGAEGATGPDGTRDREP